jgi:Dioxygenase
MRALRTAATVALAMIALSGATGCDDESRPAATGPSGASPTAGPAGSPTVGAAGCPPVPVRPVDAGSTLVPGPVNGVEASTARGDRLVVEAVVLAPSCAPAVGASVRVWHTDSRGLYGPAGTEECCYYGGTVRTDASGRFRLATIRPAQYPVPSAPPAHIHLEIRDDTGALETEILFGPAQPTPTLLVPSHAVPAELRATGPGSWYAEAAFVLEA